MQRGGGTQNEEQKRALRRRLHTEWCVIAKTKAILVMGFLFGIFEISLKYFTHLNNLGMVSK